MARIKKTIKVDKVPEKWEEAQEKKPQTPCKGPNKRTTMVKKFQMKPLGAKTGSSQSGAKGGKKTAKEGWGEFAGIDQTL